MKAQPFEFLLRHTNPPTPDPEARLRARRAALAEFERVHTDTQPKLAPVPVRTKWASRKTVWGGLATGCVVVIGVSVVWLMPPDQRQVQLHVPDPVQISVLPIQTKPIEQTPSDTQAERQA